MFRHAASLAVLLAVVLPLAASDARAQQPEKREPGFRWFVDLDEAVAEAKARNIPLFVALHKDN